MQASKLQMKKNNIMALAAHAVNNQEKLDEMFAANKRTRRDAAKKYGNLTTSGHFYKIVLIIYND